MALNIITLGFENLNIFDKTKFKIEMNKDLNKLKRLIDEEIESELKVQLKQHKHNKMVLNEINATFITNNKRYQTIETNKNLIKCLKESLTKLEKQIEHNIKC